jgi:hypothetical protein
MAASDEMTFLDSIFEAFFRSVQINVCTYTVLVGQP